MSALRALSIACRELQIPELAAAQQALVEVKAKLEEANDETRWQREFVGHLVKQADSFRRQIIRLEGEIQRLKDTVASQKQAVLRGVRENLELNERLSKRRKTKDSSA